MPSLKQHIAAARIRLANARRRKADLPPVLVVPLSGVLSQLAQPPLQVPFPRLVARFLPVPRPPPSLFELRRLFDTIGADPRIQTVLFTIEATASPAHYQTARGLIGRLRAAGKRTVAYGQGFGPFQYYLATSCDAIVMPPPADWGVAGFQQDYLFYKDALDALGVDVDLVRVSPFKSAGDTFVRTDFSPDSRAQEDWLLDARFSELVRGIAEGRKLSEDQVRGLIDGAPYSAAEAVGHGLIDAALYEDELEAWLKPTLTLKPAAAVRSNPVRRIVKQVRKPKTDAAAAPAAAPGLLINLDDARKALLQTAPPQGEKRIGVVAIEGSIAPGASFRSPVPIPIFGTQAAGSDTIAQVIRAAERDENIAAVILYVDSPGGSAFASDLIAREVRRLRAKKPVVAYFGGVAASGGYYVAALAHAIVAQPLTITGSIGVFLLRPNIARVTPKLKLHRTSLRRGENAGIFSGVEALTENQHATIQRSVQRSYDEFKRIVSEGRGIPFDALDPICEGRVWTGQMALERRLVDELGNFDAAVQRAKALAGLPDGPVPVVRVAAPRKAVFALPAAGAPASILRLVKQPHIWALADTATLQSAQD